MKSIKPANESPERIDKILTEILHVSRSQIQKAIKEKTIIVDGKPAKPHTPVDQHSVVEYDPEFFVEKEIDIGPLPELDILYEDEDAIIINKPAGFLVHATDTSKDATIVDAVLAKYPEIATVGDQPERPGIVHRLDKPASGVLIIAKNQAAFEHLKDQFKTRQTKKIYTVLVHGKTEDAGVIDFPIERAKSTGRMAAKPLSQGGREAVTEYDAIQKFQHYTLLRVKIKTGRTHQIRAHFFSIEHPVVGDMLYVQRAIKPMNIGRLFLHASELTITLPNGEERTFTAPLPAELQELLTTLAPL